MTDYAWETRKQGEETAAYLGRVLEDYLGLREMADRARKGHFDDYFCPPDIADGLETLRLVNELAAKMRTISSFTPQWTRIKEVRDAVIAGEFDSTKEESDRWAASEDGQETFKLLLDDPRAKRLFEDN